ncbi:Olfactory receptor 6C65 [Manis javanica]|nr:Olfactory receptor 6C65 [Manis javanica]
MTAFFMLLTCLLSKGGNLTIILLTLPNVCFKTPMCFFLRNFSFLEISFTTVCIPRFLCSMSTGNKTIIYNACASQLFLSFFLEQKNFFSWPSCPMMAM